MRWLQMHGNRNESDRPHPSCHPCRRASKTPFTSNSAAIAPSELRVLLVGTSRATVLGARRYTEQLRRSLTMLFEVHLARPDGSYYPMHTVVSSARL